MPKGKQILGLPRGKHLFGTAKVGEKGQLVIPKEARELFGIRPGDTLLILGDERTGILISRPDLMQDVAKNVFRTVEESAENNGKEKKK